MKFDLQYFIQSIREEIPPVVSGEQEHDGLEFALEITKQITP